MSLANLISNLHEVTPESYSLVKLLLDILALQPDGTFCFFLSIGNRVCTLFQIPSQKLSHFPILKRRFVYVLPTSVCRYYCPQLHLKKKTIQTQSRCWLDKTITVVYALNCTVHNFWFPRTWDFPSHLRSQLKQKTWDAAWLTAKYIITNVKVHLQINAKGSNGFHGQWTRIRLIPLTTMSYN